MGLSTEGNLRFKISWASLIVGKKFTVFALYPESNFPAGLTVLHFKCQPFLCQLAPEPLMVNSSERRLKHKNLVLLSEMIK